MILSLRNSALNCSAMLAICNNFVLYLTVQPLPSEEIDRLSEVKNMVSKLYSQLNVEEHQLRRETEIMAQLEEYRRQIAPMEKVTCIGLTKYTVCILCEEFKYVLLKFFSKPQLKLKEKI